MATNARQNAALALVLGDPVLKQIVLAQANAETASEDMDEAGVERKDTQYMGGPGGLLNQPGVEGSKRKKASKPAAADAEDDDSVVDDGEDGPPARKKKAAKKPTKADDKEDEADGGDDDDTEDDKPAKKKMASQSDLMDVARYLEQVVAKHAKSTEGVLGQLIEVVNDQTERIAELESGEVALKAANEIPRRQAKSFYEQLKSKSAAHSADSAVDEDDDLVEKAADALEEGAPDFMTALFGKPRK